MRVMGLDFGAKTVGVAVSDALGLTAQPVETIIRPGEKKLRTTYARIRELIAQYEIETIVVGLPKNMDGSLGERAEKSMAFADELKGKTGLPVELFDERMTTVEAERGLSEAGISKDKHKEHVDKLAASLILKGWLDMKAGMVSGDE